MITLNVKIISTHFFSVKIWQIWKPLIDINDDTCLGYALFYVGKIKAIAVTCEHDISEKNCLSFESLLALLTINFNSNTNIILLILIWKKIINFDCKFCFIELAVTTLIKCNNN